MTCRPILYVGQINEHSYSDSDSEWVRIRHKFVTIWLIPTKKMPFLTRNQESMSNSVKTSQTSCQVRGSIINILYLSAAPFLTD